MNEGRTSNVVGRASASTTDEEMSAGHAAGRVSVRTTAKEAGTINAAGLELQGLRRGDHL